MRVSPTSIDYANLGFYIFRTGGSYSAAPTLGVSMPNAVVIYQTVGSGLTVNDNGIVNQQTTGTSYFGFSAEL